jgi:hypothetical protein
MTTKKVVLIVIVVNVVGAVLALALMKLRESA